jgi:hypothetical protein
MQPQPEPAVLVEHAHYTREHRVRVGNRLGAEREHREGIRLCPLQRSVSPLRLNSRKNAFFLRVSKMSFTFSTVPCTG